MQAEVRENSELAGLYPESECWESETNQAPYYWQT